MGDTLIENNLTEVGIYNPQFNNILNISLPCNSIFQSDGLYLHIQKRHPNCINYLNNIPDIISSPDYIGTNPNEPNSIELVKRYDDNIMIGIKLDITNNYLYVASLFDIKEGKIQRRLHSGRLKEFNNNP